jgi:hypothetical protein
MKRYLVAGALLAILAGCGSVPFRGEERVPIAASEPRAAAEHFRTMVPDKFYLLSSIVFEYNFRSISGIGYVDIDVASGVYKVMCMNQLGVKLFEFYGDRNGLISQYAIEPLARQGNIAAAVGEDIKRIYLDLMPDPDASRAVKRKYAVIFRQKSGDGELEYQFSGRGPCLSRKTYSEDQQAIWRVSYYEYEEKNGKLYPMGIVFTNYKYGYRLIVRVKEIKG